MRIHTRIHDFVGHCQCRIVTSRHHGRSLYLPRFLGLPWLGEEPSKAPEKGLALGEVLVDLDGLLVRAADLLPLLVQGDERVGGVLLDVLGDAEAAGERLGGLLGLVRGVVLELLHRLVLQPAGVAESVLVTLLGVGGGLVRPRRLLRRLGLRVGVGVEGVRLRRSRGLAAAWHLGRPQCKGWLEVPRPASNKGAGPPSSFKFRESLIRIM